MQKTHELIVTIDFEKPLSEADAKKWLLAAIAQGNGKQPGPVVKQAARLGEPDDHFDFGPEAPHA